MNKRDRSRQWYFRSLGRFGVNILVGNSKIPTQRLTDVKIGDWLDIELIKGKTKQSKETYRVRFDGTEYVVRIDSKGNPIIKLRWADSFVNAKPTNIGQLMSSTANAKRKRS